MREELNQMFLKGTDNQDDQNDMMMINKALSANIKELQNQITMEKKIRQQEVSRMKAEVNDAKKKYEANNRDALNRDREVDQAKKMAFSTKEETEKKLRDAESMMA